MYKQYFGFSDFPFENNLDQRFLFLSEDHQEVLAALLYFIKAKKSFAIVCGDVGTGKTMLINSFLTRLPESVLPVIVSNPYVSSQDLLQYIAQALNIGTAGEKSTLDLTDKVKAALIETQRRQNQLVLLVDEAHLLSDRSLEEIRLLSNLETPEQKLLQILLVGQYELSYILDRPEMRHLRQRLNINRFLSSLNSFETIQYIDHRLKQVGSSFASVFEANCQKLIFRITGGVPRRINQVCDNALLICMTEGVLKVTPKILKKAEEALRTDLIFTPKFARGKGLWPLRGFFNFRKMTVAVIAFLIIGMASFNSIILFKNLHQLSSKASRSTGTPTEAKTNIVSHAEGPLPLKAAKPEPLAPGEESGSEARPPYFPTSPYGVTPKEGENAEQPGSVSLQQSSPEEVRSAFSTSGESLPPKAHISVEGEKLTAKAGQSLTVIAAQHYPKDRELGLRALILANPKITNADLIHTGQSLYLPAVNFSKRTVRLRDGLFYAFYGQYLSPDGIGKDTSRLIKNQVRFQVIDTKDSAGRVIYRIFVGGYDSEEGLAKTVGNLK
jgi:type II secretory pathway predicted ATPase ExeA